MSSYQHFTSFNLTDPRTGKTKNLTDDFGGIIINTSESTYDRECMPQLNFITDRNDTRDGEIFIDATYGIRTIDMTVFFEDEGADITEFKKWLYKSYQGKKYQQIFEWDNDDENKAILAIESGGFQSKVYYQKNFYGEIPLKFICHDPYYFIKNEKDIVFSNLVVGDSRNIRCAGNTESYPLIKITPNTTTVKMKWNDLLITLSNLTIGKTYYLDCKLCQCYEMINNIKVLSASKYYSTKYIDFPVVYSDDKNSFIITEGSINNISITLRSRII